jgi:single-strand DNA-binding protein
MANSLNKAILIGNLGKDPEVRFTQSGARIATFPLATNESWKDKLSGERKEKTEWHRVVIMNEKLAEIAEKYLKKGSKIALEGQIQTRKWTDSNQIERYSTEIILSNYRGELILLDRSEGGYQSVENSTHPSDSSQGSSGNLESLEGNRLTSSTMGPLDDLNDEIPF